jgi:HAD superfamily hydrolase (TIGR01509 family)
MPPGRPSETPPAARAFDLVIFDCDGVLVDSERLQNEVFVAMLHELGIEITMAGMFEQFVGHSMAYCMALVERMLGRPPPADFLPRLQARTFEAFRDGLQPVDGIVEALDRLALPTCVASGGDHDKIRFTLGHTGLWSRFEGRIFSVVDVPRAKPHPDVYLHAARTLGAAPARCAVVEDTPVGVTAAVAAGMTVFGYARLTPAAHLAAAGAHRLFTDMRILPEMLLTPDAAALR